ncbi:hypothetical protein [Mariprofundus sp. KV]|uniref:hypothetical protein n=1 Tax=Mariprofundus sp. KV TaxID=2608715 RepID=UPI0015A09C51|nr:hypothetical protein [Mariprofundus sp. KV]NWF37520.1 hypothetical protein [Mariprofundus sp. KV]
MADQKKPASVSAIKVNQWLTEWDEVDFNSECHRSKPEPFFYMFSMPASQLKALSGISRRSTKDRKLGQTELGIQRLHEEGRSKEIKEFVRYGYPWSSLESPQEALFNFSLTNSSWHRKRFQVS